MKTITFPVSRLQFPSWSGLTARVPDFIALMKPRVMVLAIFTAAAGLFIALGDLDPLVGAVSIIGIAAGVSAAGVLNMWYDADIDAVMTRTANALAFELGVLIVMLVAAGSIFIMANLNETMMLPPELMNPHMQH